VGVTTPSRLRRERWSQAASRTVSAGHGLVSDMVTKV
jgi:hypothetical protein